MYLVDGVRKHMMQCLGLCQFWIWSEKMKLVTCFQVHGDLLSSYKFKSVFKLSSCPNLYWPMYLYFCMYVEFGECLLIFRLDKISFCMPETWSFIQINPKTGRNRSLTAFFHTLSVHHSHIVLPSDAVCSWQPRTLTCKKNRNETFCDWNWTLCWWPIVLKCSLYSSIYKPPLIALSPFLS